MQKILIAEDDVILREILQGKLTTAGYTALTAEDGGKALDIIRAEHPDLILLDILLPIKNGMEVLSEMQRDANIKSIPVIALSNSDNPDAIKQAKALGVREFLIKAIFDSRDVIEKIKQILQTPPPSALPIQPTPTSIPIPPLAPPTIPTPQTEVKLPEPAVAPTEIAPTVAPLEVAPIVTTTPTDKKRVLIVEDDRFLREIAGQKLEAEDFVVSSATSGKETFEFLEKGPNPSIIVLDLILPGMSGFEILEKLKGNVDWRGIPVLILSNLGQEEDIEKAKKLGAVDYLVKAHFSFAEIIKKIREIVG